MTLNSSQSEALEKFCDIIVCGRNEMVFKRCKECMENAEDEYGGIPDVLYVLSGQDTDQADPFGNVADADKQLLKQQYYFISSDAGAPDLDDFFIYIENIKAACGLSFTVNKEKCSCNDCIVEWLAELSAQLKDLYIVNFDGGSEDYHFTIMDKQDCEKAMALFGRLTTHIVGYKYSSFVITDDFLG